MYFTTIKKNLKKENKNKGKCKRKKRKSLESCNDFILGNNNNNNNKKISQKHSAHSRDMSILSQDVKRKTTELIKIACKQDNSNYLIIEFRIML